MSENTCTEQSILTEKLGGFFHGIPAGIIFDCDGVLVDSMMANMKYYNMLRDGLGLPRLTPDQEYYCQISTVMQAIEHIIPEALRPHLGAVMEHISYERDIEPLILPSKNLHHLLDMCADWGMRLGVHTNRASDLSHLFAQCGLSGRFSPVVTAAEVAPKPDPAGTLRVLQEWNLPPERVLFIGDGSTDRDAAETARVPFLAYRNPTLTEVCCHDFGALEGALKALKTL